MGRFCLETRDIYERHFLTATFKKKILITAMNYGLIIASEDAYKNKVQRRLKINAAFNQGMCYQAK